MHKKHKKTKRTKGTKSAKKHPKAKNTNKRTIIKNVLTNIQGEIVTYLLICVFALAKKK